MRSASSASFILRSQRPLVREQEVLGNLLSDGGGADCMRAEPPLRTLMTSARTTPIASTPACS